MISLPASCWSPSSHPQRLWPEYSGWLPATAFDPESPACRPPCSILSPAASSRADDRDRSRLRSRGQFTTTLDLLNERAAIENRPRPERSKTNWSSRRSQICVNYGQWAGAIWRTRLRLRLHPTILFDDAMPPPRSRAEKRVNIIFECCIMLLIAATSRHQLIGSSVLKAVWDNSR